MGSPTVSWPWRGAHLAVLWAFAVVQPLLDLLGKNAEFFIARGNGAGDVLIFSIGLTLLPPLVLVGLEAAVGLSSRRGEWWVHVGLVGALFGAFALQLLDSVFDVPAGVLVFGALVLGVAAAVRYARSEPTRALVSYLAPAPLVFLSLFLLASDASKVVLPQDEAEALGAGSGGTPVVFVQFDELATASLGNGRGGIDRRRFPNFAELAAASTWYRSATTVADHTTESLPAILTGSRPDRKLDPLASDYPENMFTLFAGEGRLNVHEYTARLCPEAFCESRAGSFRSRMRALVEDLSVISAYLLLPPGLTGGLPPVDEGFGNFGGASGGSEGDLTFTGIDKGAIDAFLAGIERDPRSLHYIHMSLPHVPWQYLPNGQSYGRGDVWREFDEDQEVWPAGNDWVPRQGQRAHLLQAGYADRILGRVIERLRESGIFDDALVVVLADHGVAFTPGDSRRNTEAGNVGEIAPIPLFVKAPGQPHGQVDERPVTTIDILPTIADLLGIEIPFEVEGRPASEVPEADTITVLRHDGNKALEFDLEEVRRQRDLAAEGVSDLFGTGWQPVWRMGPNDELIGRSVARLPRTAGEGSFAQSDADQLDDVDPDGAFVPSLVTGTLKGVEAGTALAVAVNGRIAAVGQSYDSVFGGVRTALLVPPSGFRAGANAVALFEVGGGDRLQLRAVDQD